jgi:hypothetical protein
MPMTPCRLIDSNCDGYQIVEKVLTQKGYVAERDFVLAA